MSQVARAVVERLVDAERLSPMVGVIHYDSDRVQVVLPMTRDVSRSLPLVTRATSSQGHNFLYEESAERAVDMLEEVRGDSSPVEIIVWFGALKSIGLREDVLIQRAGMILKESGARLLVGCPASALRCQEVRQIPPSLEDYSEPPSRTELPDRLGVILAGLFDGVSDIRSMVVTSTLSAELAYLDGSADVPPSEVVSDGEATHLVWRIEGAAANAPLTVTYGLEPIGDGEASILSTLDFVDRTGATGAISDTLSLEVASVCPTPTATATATSTAEPTPLPTRPDVPTEPSATVAPAPSIYLPALVNEPCAPVLRRADVVLVIDASSSMETVERDGRRRLDAARDAASTFLEGLSPTDQAAVVWFNEVAHLEQELTSQHQLAQQALERITTAEYTRLDLGISVAHAELLSHRRVAANRAAIILLTDGRANPVPISAAEETAAAAKNEGITIFTIGLGAAEELDDESLGRIASDPAYYFRTPDASELTDIYRTIAAVVPCPR